MTTKIEKIDRWVEVKPNVSRRVRTYKVNGVEYKLLREAKAAAKAPVDEEMSEEQRIIQENTKLLVNGDDTEVCCEIHNVTKRWGDLSPLAQLAVLAGIDTTEDLRCLMVEKDG